MTSVLLICTLLTPILATNGYYHQEYKYQTSSSSYKNHELQHQNDDEGYYSKDGDLEGRYRPRVNAHSQHSEYVNPKLQHGYRIGTDRTSSFGQLHAHDRFRLAEPQFEGGAYIPVHNYGVTSNLREVTASLQREMERELQRSVFEHAQRAMAYGDITQAQIDTDRRILEEELRRNVTMRLQEALKMQYGNQGIRGAYSYSIRDGRLQPSANYDNQELTDLTRQMEENLIRNLNQQIQTYYRTEVHTQSQRNTYRINGNGNYPEPLQVRPPVPVYHQTYPPPNPVLAQPDSITTVASRVQTELNEILNKILQDTQKRYFSENTYSPGINHEAILAQLQNELRANITYHFDEEIKRAYGYTNYAQKFSMEDIENLRRQIEANLITKLNRDFNRQREKYVIRHQMYPMPIPANHVYYPNQHQHQSNIVHIQNQMQEQLSRQLQEALMRHSYSQAMYSNSAVNSQAHYQRALEALSAELNRNLTRQMEQLNAQQYQIGVHDSQLAAMRSQLQQDLMRQLQQGLQQSYSQYSSWSSSSRSSSGNYRPVRGFDPNAYNMGDDCMYGDDSGVFQRNKRDLTQQPYQQEVKIGPPVTSYTPKPILAEALQSQDLIIPRANNPELTQQSQDLTQQDQELTIPIGDDPEVYQQQNDDDLTQQTEDLTQQNQDLTQQTEDLTEQSQDLTQQTEDLTQQSQDLTQQTEDLTQNDDLTQQSQDLTQQTEDLTQQSQDLTQDYLGKPKSYSQIGPSISQKPSQDLTQLEQKPANQAPYQQQTINGPPVNSYNPKPVYVEAIQEPQQSQDLTQQSQDLTQQNLSNLGPVLTGPPVTAYTPKPSYEKPQQFFTQQNPVYYRRPSRYQTPRYYRQQIPQQNVLVDPSRNYRTQQYPLTQQNQDLTQQNQEPQVDIGPAESYQQPPIDNTPLTQQSQDLTEPIQTMYQNPVAIDPAPSQYMTQQNQDLTQNVEPPFQRQQATNLYKPYETPKYTSTYSWRPQRQNLDRNVGQRIQYYENLNKPTSYRQQTWRPQQTSEFPPLQLPSQKQSQDLTQQEYVTLYRNPWVDDPAPSQYLPKQNQDLTKPIQMHKPIVAVDPVPIEYLPQQNQDLTQQSQDLTQQNQDLTQQNQDLTQQNQDLTQQNQDLTEPIQMYRNPVAIDPVPSQYWKQQNQDLTQQSQDLTQQNQDLTKPIQMYRNPVAIDPAPSHWTRQSQDLTQPMQIMYQNPVAIDPVPSQDLTQQVEDIEQPVEPLQSQDLTQKNQDLPQQTQKMFGPSVTSDPIRYIPVQSQDLTQQTQDLTQQSQDLTQDSQDLTQQTEDINQPIEPEISLNKIAKDQPFQQPKSNSDQSSDRQKLREAQRESQHLIDLLRRESQQQQAENLGQMNYSPKPVYADFEGQQVQVGTTRELNQEQVPVSPNDQQSGRSLKTQTPRISTLPEQETQTVREIEPVEPQVASEVQQVDVIAETTTKKPGFWSRVGTSIKNKLG